MPTLAELCRAVKGELKGAGDVEISGVGSLEGAGPGDIAPLDSERYLRLAETSRAGALLASREVADEIDRPAIVADFPLVALNQVMAVLGLIPPPPAPGIHATAIVDETAEVGADVHVGPGVVVEAGVKIGARCVLQTGVYVERGVEMGDDCFLAPYAVLHNGCHLGHRVRVGAHAVLSRQGFGYAPGPTGPVRLAHIGRVILEDDVHIGAGAAVDRARYDETRVGRFSALDNLVHIGHNCVIGQRTFIAAQTGFAGTARIGDDCEVGGQVGVSNDVRIGNKVRVGAQAGVIGPIDDGAELWGTPARDKAEYLRQLAALRRLAGK